MWLIFITWGCPTCPTFFFAMSSFYWPIAKKKFQLWSLLELQHSIPSKMESLSFGLVIYVKRGRLWPKYMGLKWILIGNTFWEHVANLMGTRWEFQNNIEGICSEQKERWKEILSPTPKFKRNKNRATLSAWFTLPVARMYFSFPKLFLA